jgi:signal transduction histidine kinase
VADLNFQENPETISKQERLQQLSRSGYLEFQSSKDNSPPRFENSEDLLKLCGLHLKAFVCNQPQFLQKIHPEDRQKYLSHIQELNEFPKQMHSWNLRIQCPDKSGKLCDQSGYALLHFEFPGDSDSAQEGWFQVIPDTKVTQNWMEHQAGFLEGQQLGRFGDWQVDWITNRFSCSPSLAETLFPNEKPIQFFNEYLHRIHPEDKERVISFFARRGGEHNSHPVEYRFRSGDSWKELNTWVRFDSSRGKSGVVKGLTQDVSETKILERAMKDAQQEAEKTSRLKSIFLSNISHELRTPLNSIVGFARLFRKHKEPELQEEYADIIENSAEKLLDIVNNIIEYSRIESGSLRLDIREKSLQELSQPIKDFGNKWIHRYQKRDQVQFHLELPTAPVKLLIDEKAFLDIMEILIHNAVKFTPEGEITFRLTDVKDSEAVFQVEDTGVGISPENQKAILSPFRQEDEGKGRKFEGQGLGLAICKGLIDLHGGEFWLESTKGKGTIFSFSIPISIREKSLPETEKFEFLKSASLLLVDDQRHIHSIIRNHFENSGLHIIHAYSGLEAIEKAKNFGDRIGLVLMDIQMPGIDGVQAARKIREVYDFPIIAQTGALHFKQHNEFEEVLQKPLERRTLFHICRKYLLNGKE